MIHCDVCNSKIYSPADVTTTIKAAKDDGLSHVCEECQEELDIAYQETLGRVKVVAYMHEIKKLRSQKQPKKYKYDGKLNIFHIEEPKEDKL